MFEDEHKKAIKSYNNKKFLLCILTILVLDTVVISLNILVFKQTWKEVLSPSLIIMLTINAYMMIKARSILIPYNLQGKAETFANTVYYNDLVAALETRCQMGGLTKHLIQKYARINSHFNAEIIAFEAMEVKIRYKEHDEKLFVTYEGNAYYITGWGFYSDGYFIFYLERIREDGRKRILTLALSVPQTVTPPAQVDVSTKENVLESVE